MAQINIAGTLHNTEEIQGDALNSHVVAHTDEILDTEHEKKQSEVNADVDAALAERYTKEETYSKEQVNELITTPDVNYVSVVATNATTAVTDILPATGEADTVYRVGNWNGTQYDPTMYALYAWNGSEYVCLAVRSFVGEVYDISVNHPDGQGNPTPYADLAAALGTSGANIPADIRRGGMRIQFIKGTVQSSDNKYVQFRYMLEYANTTAGNAAFVNPDNWSFCGNEVLVDNPEYIKAETDAAGHLLFWIKFDGSVDWAIGVPEPVKAYINACIKDIVDGNEGTDIDGLNKIIAFLDDFSTSDTLAPLLNTKVDKQEGKGLIQSEVAESLSVIDNPEYMDVETDAENKVLGGRKTDGTKFENMPLETPTSNITYVDNPEWIDVETDKDGKIIRGIRKDGTEYSIEKENNYVVPDYKANIFSAYDNIVSIGDSLTFSEVFTANGVDRQAYNPWPKCVKKLSGLDECIIYARSGKSTIEIWDLFKDSFAVPATGKTICTIYLGTNGWLEDTLDTSAPASDVENYRNAWADDYTGSMCKIIQTFINFGCKILLIRPWAGGNSGTDCPSWWQVRNTNEVIKKIAERFKCAYIDAADIQLQDNVYHYYPNLSGKNTLHYNDLGYAQFASTLIDKMSDYCKHMEYLIPE